MPSQPLAYNKSLPPFLARLHAQQSSPHNQGPDPRLAGNRRYARPKPQDELDEEEPLVVDNSGNVVEGVRVDAGGKVTGQDGDDSAPPIGGDGADGGQGGAGGDDGNGNGEAGEGKKPGGKTVPKPTNRKRKIGRIIGDDAEDDPTVMGGKQKLKQKKNLKDDPLAQAIKAQGGSVGAVSGKGKEEEGGKGGKTTGEKKTKKGKKIKLSFDDED